jgi:hypothetical protein
MKIFSKKKKWGWKLSLFPSNLIFYIFVFVMSEGGDQEMTRMIIAD